MAKRALGHALDAVLGARSDVAVRWVRRPFILRPERKGFLPWLEVLTELSYARVGSRAWVDGFTRSMKENGREVGIEFNFGGDVGNSFDSLRAVAWAGTQDPAAALQNAFCDILHRNHFERALCVAKHENIVAAAAEAGLDAEACAAVLADPAAFADAVSADLAAAAHQHIHSIPQVALYYVSDLPAAAPDAKALADYVSHARPGAEAGGARSAEEYSAMLRAVLP
eukprot:TRINITY_DN16812_c0_g1_i1.p1 TRINITY_DN16812_c0_g1~~TRINITY_DN16812_c0_g1_i1.p1  ORF type:complete len:226 (+),score=85.82 TRINITY_DN16812_c0_g1_i1:125-802(+)